MKREDDEKLWDLLGHAAEPDISPFFARNVVRQARARTGWGSLASARAWFRPGRLIPVSGLAIALALVVFVGHNASIPQDPVVSELDPVAKIDPQDYEVVADLDELLASDENSLWDENSSL